MYGLHTINLVLLSFDNSCDHSKKRFPRPAAAAGLLKACCSQCCADCPAGGQVPLTGLLSVKAVLWGSGVSCGSVGFVGEPEAHMEES